MICNLFELIPAWGGVLESPAVGRQSVGLILLAPDRNESTWPTIPH